MKMRHRRKQFWVDYVTMWSPLGGMIYQFYMQRRKS